MTRTSFRPGPWNLPQPVTIIGTYDPDGTPNAMNAAWTGQYDETQVVLCLSEGHRTTKNIRETGEFTISFATRAQAAACDYVGMASGNVVKDKIAHTGWTVTQAETVHAPVFEELPMTLECRLAGTTENGNLIGEIVNITCDDACLNEEGRPDVEKMELLTFNPVDRTYLQIGEAVAGAWQAGKALLKNN